MLNVRVGDYLLQRGQDLRWRVFYNDALVGFAFTEREARDIVVDHRSERRRQARRSVG